MSAAANLLQILGVDPASDDGRATATAWAAAWVQAQEAWPGVAVAEAAVASWVADRMDPALESSAALGLLCVADLYLACGCMRGQDDAVRAFERAFGRDLDGAAARAGVGATDEVVQQLREKLMVGPDARLQAYSGTGPLRRWLKVACHRLALDHRRDERRRRPPSAEQLADRLVGADAELDLLKGRYREAFKEAFADAMRTLTPRTRMMLRLHLIQGLSIDEIAPMHKVHRSSAARWLAAAREEVLGRTRERLGALLGARSGDVDSIMELIASRLDVTITRHLREDD